MTGFSRATGRVIGGQAVEYDEMAQMLNETCTGYTVNPRLDKHTEIVGDVPLEILAENIGNLRYDCLGKFLHLLSIKLSVDAEKDLNRGREKLSTVLFNASQALLKAQDSIDEAWKISKPFMGMVQS